MEELSQTAEMVAQNLQSMATLRDNLQETFSFEFSAKINGAIDGFARLGSGISGVVSSAKNGDIFGVVNGVVDVFAGIGDGIASIFGDGSARTKKINKEIEKSVETVRQLNMAYKELEATVNRAMGAEETSARREQIKNKEAQLAELERQKTLEQSKRSKDRDDDKIKEYEETIQEFRLSIADLKDEIVSNLFGEDVKSAAESFVDAWVDAWKEGEDTLDAISEKMDDMIANLIKKVTTSAIVGKILQPLYDAVDQYTSETSESGTELTKSELQALAVLAQKLGVDINTALVEFYGNLETLGIMTKNITDGKSSLSALQQGIQGISEDTAGALEAYMNSISQQVYLQSELLTQLRDALVNFDLDVQVATMSQMLLQLQQSYQVQLAIQNILNGWSNPSGMAVRVEMV